MTSMILIFSSFEVNTQTNDPVPRKPVIDSEWWRRSEAPDLDSLNGLAPDWLANPDYRQTTLTKELLMKR